MRIIIQQTENIKREIENIKNSYMEILKLKSIITIMKNSLNGLNRKLEIAGEWTSELADRALETIQYEGERKKKIEERWGKSQRPVRQPQSYQQTVKKTSEESKEERDRKIRVEKGPQIMKHININIKKAQGHPSKINT